MTDETSAYARNTDRDTSHDAAESVRATDLENTVLTELRKFPNGATSYRLAESLGLSLVTVSPRLRPLVSKGLAEDSGRRATGPSGRSQTVWRAVTKQSSKGGGPTDGHLNASTDVGAAS